MIKRLTGGKKTPNTKDRTHGIAWVTMGECASALAVFVGFLNLYGWSYESRPKPGRDGMPIFTKICESNSSLNKLYRHLHNSLIRNNNGALLSELVLWDVNRSLIVAYRITLLI